MKDDTDIIALRQPGSVDVPSTGIARDGAPDAGRRAEGRAEAFAAQYATEILSDGRNRVARHGYGPEPSIPTGIRGARPAPPEGGGRAAGPQK